VSSHQFDDLSRGFTFREGAPLDMRMGTDADLGADDLLNTIDEVDLSALLRAYADEPRAARMAREIVRRRERRPFATADDLVDAIRAVLGPRSGPPDFARIFQAVRIAVNDELDGLERALPKLRDRLTVGGVLAIISYHSGEDRLVKNAFRDWSARCICPPKQMMCTCRGEPLGTTLTKRPINANDAEIEVNPRARSARLRAWRRVSDVDVNADVTRRGVAR
jgi:16S rRNA (cytosine1402-N4)-methyltransferase